jgi:dolichol-phosphate mannosyltransferase/undecaprenyl-phosphate 4-deoxy-4-formamido-L-arabinose transferase
MRTELQTAVSAGGFRQHDYSTDGSMDVTRTEKDLFSIVIPVFNSTATLEQMAERIETVFSGLPQFEYEIIFVDDASERTETWPTLQRIAARDPRVRAVQLMRNFGQTAATFCGMKLARGEYIVTLDDDLQHAPEDIPLLIAERQHDVVFGQFRELRHSAYKRWLSHTKNLLLSILIDKPRNVQLTSFRLFRRELAQAMLSVVTSPQATLPPLLFFMTRDVATVQVTHNARQDGSSNYTLRRVLRLAKNLLLNETVLLLRLIGQLGLAIAALSFVGGILVIANRILLKSMVAGWASIMIVQLVIGGLILFCLGIIGEYLARLISGVEGRPAFVIRREAARARMGTDAIGS